jgi:hypothetical protein
MTRFQLAVFGMRCFLRGRAMREACAEHVRRRNPVRAALCAVAHGLYDAVVMFVEFTLERDAPPPPPVPETPRTTRMTIVPPAPIDPKRMN